ncbi:MAG TPA: pentapeptide repeat-containing protein, partial [Pseudonocardiaceae bacterium]|nr:pentapeptide repeat-containing protein [Pseudonocardiaceae bacterium]
MSAVPWLVVGWLCTAGGTLALVFAWVATGGEGRDRQRQRQWVLTGALVFAVGVFTLVSGLLLGAAGTSAAAALQTGGLAAVVVLALYALWLLDRRQRLAEDGRTLAEQQAELDDRRLRLEESRQELDRVRTDEDRGRGADERFARALELLGHEADQVRVGALHALAGLARNRPDYTQTTLDILCAYLRRPYDHATYLERRTADTAGDPPPDQQDNAWQDVESDRERQVRLAAQRLIIDLLPSVSDPDAPDYHLDLTGAALEYFDLSHKHVGTLTARSAHFYTAVSFEGARFTGPIWLTWAHLWGEVFRANDMVCQGIAWWSNFTASGPVEFDRTEFHGETKFAYATFADRVSFAGCRF